MRKTSSETFRPRGLQPFIPSLPLGMAVSCQPLLLVQAASQGPGSPPPRSQSHCPCQDASPSPYGWAEGAGTMAGGRPLESCRRQVPVSHKNDGALTPRYRSRRSLAHRETNAINQPSVWKCATLYRVLSLLLARCSLWAGPGSLMVGKGSPLGP